MSTKAGFPRSVMMTGAWRDARLAALTSWLSWREVMVDEAVGSGVVVTPSLCRYLPTFFY